MTCTGATPLNDPLLAIFAQLDADPPLELAKIDDDGGDGFNALITYTASYSGLHVIAATGQPFPGTLAPDRAVILVTQVSTMEIAAFGQRRTASSTRGRSSSGGVSSST